MCRWNSFNATEPSTTYVQVQYTCTNCTHTFAFMHSVHSQSHHTCTYICTCSKTECMYWYLQIRYVHVQCTRARLVYCESMSAQLQLCSTVEATNHTRKPPIVNTLVLNSKSHANTLTCGLNPIEP